MMNKNYIGKEVGEVYDKRGSRIHTGMMYGKKTFEHFKQGGWENSEKKCSSLNR